LLKEGLGMAKTAISVIDDAMRQDKKTRREFLHGGGEVREDQELGGLFLKLANEEAKTSDIIK
jgi:hypothetical protein